MRARDLSVSLIAAVLLHLMAGYSLGILLATIDSRKVAPDFKKGLTSMELNLVSVSKPVPVKATELPSISETVLVKEERKEPDQEEPVEIDPVDPGVQETFAEATTTVRPSYPLGSRLRGEEGEVTIRVSIDASGRVSAAEILETSGFSSLDKAGLTAVRKAIFRYPQGAVASSTETTVTFRFKLVD